MSAPNNFSKNDVFKIKSLGYAIDTQSGIPMETFMKKKFPGFDLLKLLQIVESSFSPTTKRAIHRLIVFSNTPPVLRIEFKNECKVESDALLFIREFFIIKKEIHIKHEYCIIPAASRNKGLIKPVFQESLRQYTNMGAKKILVHAGLSGGGYAWARHGFVAVDKKEVDAILQKAKKSFSKKEFNKVRKIYDVYYAKNPGGKAFPMDLWAAFDCMREVLMGSDWHGEIDFENEEQFRNFNAYVNR